MVLYLSLQSTNNRGKALLLFVILDSAHVRKQHLLRYKCHRGSSRL